MQLFSIIELYNIIWPFLHDLRDLFHSKASHSRAPHAKHRWSRFRTDTKQMTLHHRISFTISQQRYWGTAMTLLRGDISSGRAVLRCLKWQIEDEKKIFYNLLFLRWFSFLFYDFLTIFFSVLRFLRRFHDVLRLNLINRDNTKLFYCLKSIKTFFFCSKLNT